MMGGKYTKELPAELEPGMSASKEIHEEVRALMLSRGSCFHACTLSLIVWSRCNQAVTVNFLHGEERKVCFGPLNVKNTQNQILTC